MRSSPVRYSRLPILSLKSWINPLQDHSPIRKSNNCVVDTPQAYTTESFSAWRPVYLSKRALAAFLMTFSALAAGAQIMLLLSKRNSGLSGVNDGLHRVLWRYGPTALLTLVASFWTRVECQAKTIAPWIKMTRGFTATRESVMLDYLSQFQLFSITSAIKNKDHTVAATTFTSLLIRALLILSTSLCSLSPTQKVPSNVPMTLKSDFVNSLSGLTANGSLAFASFASMMRSGTSLPQGTSDKFAYQLIESDFLDTPSTIYTTVDGFSGDLECEPAALPVNSTLWNTSYTSYWNPIPIRSESCSFDINLSIGTSTYQGRTHFVALEPGGCGGSSKIDDQRLGIFIAIVTSTGGHENMKISTSNSFICKPTYQIRRLDFTSRGQARTVSPSKTANSRTLTNVHPWHIMQSHLDEVSYLPDDITIISNQTVYFDQYTFLAYLLANASGNPPELSTIFEDQDGQRLSFQTTTSNTLPSWLTSHLCNQLQVHWREQ